MPIPNIINVVHECCSQSKIIKSKINNSSEKKGTLSRASKLAAAYSQVDAAEYKVEQGSSEKPNLKSDIASSPLSNGSDVPDLIHRGNNQPKCTSKSSYARPSSRQTSETIPSRYVIQCGG